MKKLALSLVALAAAVAATPASAAVEMGSCASAPLNPSADKCAGYFDQNQFSNKDDSVALQQSAVNSLLGEGVYKVDWNALVAANKVVSGSDFTLLNNLLATAGGQVLLGLHWGNVPNGGGNVSAFYLWNNVQTGSIRLTETQGYSNAVLYRSTASVAAVPEPGTWALMLLGFGAVGGALRRRRPQQTFIAQVG